MNCVLCKHGETKAGNVTVNLERGDTTVIIKNVPADVCENCGEYYLTEPVSGNVMTKAERAVQNGVELEIVQFTRNNSVF